MKPERSKSSEWWKDTANHMWRTYFALLRDGCTQDEMSETNKRIYVVCDHIFHTAFVPSDQDILRAYFTCRWGDDIYMVEDYSAKHNIPVKIIWMVIRRANRTAMEETGLLEKRDPDT